MVELYSGTVYNLALRLTNNPQDAEEVLQETFISAFRSLDRFEGRSRLSTWLYRIAYNAALMRLRRREPPTDSIDEPVINEEGEELPRQLVDWSTTPDQIALDSELRAALDAAMTRLPETLRSVFVLRDIEGLSTTETAETLGISEANVKVRLHRARLALRNLLAGYFADHEQPDDSAGDARQEAYVRTL